MPHYTEEEYASALGTAITDIEWQLQGLDDPDDETYVLATHTLQVLRHLYAWHAGHEYGEEGT